MTITDPEVFTSNIFLHHPVVYITGAILSFFIFVATARIFGMLDKNDSSSVGLVTVFALIIAGCWPMILYLTIILGVVTIPLYGAYKATNIAAWVTDKVIDGMKNAVVNPKKELPRVQSVDDPYLKAAQQEIDHMLTRELV